MTSNSLREKILNEVDIVDYISRDIDLIKKGINYVGLCPFHNDTTPSYTVNREKKYSKCFSCGNGGNVIEYVQKTKNITYQDALNQLAQEIGISVKVKEINKKNDHYLNEDILEYYQVVLNLEHIGKLSRTYLNKRGYTIEMIKNYRLGYAPEKRGKLKLYLESKVASAKYSQIDIEKYLPYQNDTNNKRLMIPIMDDNNRVVGFSGRTLVDEDPKYINSRENDVFKKKEILYNMNNAKRVDTNKLYIVEGFFDVFALDKIGKKNSVALMGTAFTKDHIELIKKYRFTEIIFCLDQDRAGQTTTIKSAEKLLEFNISNISIINFNETKDIDEFVNTKTELEIDEIMRYPIDYFEYKIKSLPQYFDITSVDGKGRYIKAVLKSIEKIDTYKRETILTILSDKVDITPERLMLLVDNTQQLDRTIPKQVIQKKSEVPKDEDALMKYSLINKYNYNKVREHLDKNQEMFSMYQSLFDKLEKYYYIYDTYDTVNFIDYIGDDFEIYINQINEIKSKNIELSKINLIFENIRKKQPGIRIFKKGS